MRRRALLASCWQSQQMHLHGGLIQTSAAVSRLHSRVAPPSHAHSHAHSRRQSQPPSHVPRRLYSERQLEGGLGRETRRESRLMALSEHNFATRPMEELFPVLAALADRGDFETVDQLATLLRTRRPQDWKRALHTPAIPNMLFKAALDEFVRGNQTITLTGLKERLHTLRRDLGLEDRTRGVSVRPDVLSFALMVRFVLVAGAAEATSASSIATDTSSTATDVSPVMDDASLAMDLRLLVAEAADCDIGSEMLHECIREGQLFTSAEWARFLLLAPLPTGRLVETLEADKSKDELRKRVSAPRRALPSTETLPEVRAVASKSEGISFIRDSLRQLDTLAPETLGDADVLHQTQLRLEQDCYASMLVKLRHEAEALAKVTGTGNLTNIRHDLLQWHEALRAAIEAEFDGRHVSDVQVGGVSGGVRDDAVDAKNSAATFSTTPTTPNTPATSTTSTADNSYYMCMLTALDAERISMVVIQELLKLALYEPFLLTSSESAPVHIKAARLVTLATSIGAALQREIFSVQISRKPFLNRAQLSPLQLARVFDSRRTLDRSMRRVYAQMEGDLEAQRDGWIPAWSSGLRAEIGTFLLAVAERTLRFQRQDGQIVAPFAHAVVHGGGIRRVGVIRMEEEVFVRLRAERQLSLVEAWAMPMLVPPKPWLTITSGGYLTYKNTCVRLKDDPVHLSLLTESQKSGQLEAVLEGLDVLGRVAWTINEPVLRVAIELWNRGANVSELEREDKPDTTVAEELPFMRPDEFPTPEAYRAYCRQVVEHRNEQTRHHSMACDTNYKLEIARTFAGVSFYFPHSVDFRGRAYPIPPHLSHIGSDLSRGLLLFGEGRVLGEHGLFWLKVHFANMCGQDKCSLEERVAFADRHRLDIDASARDPLAPDAFWRRAEEPWQCLAMCMELSAALASANPANFVSHLPVQQDGSCNGSQHYAALGGDVEGAVQVNLVPSATPQDIYGTVARIVSREIDRDLATLTRTNAVEAKTAPAVEESPNHTVDEDSALTLRVAQLLQGRVTRKIVKQPVMTNIYGVTMFGARKQIEARLREYDVIPAGEEQLMRRARSYLTTKVFSALDELFVKARQIQDWLAYCATEICRSVPLPVAERYGFRPGDAACIDDTDARIDELRRINASGWNPCLEHARQGGDETVTLTDRFPQTPVSWTTPLGFRVLQPYLRTSSVQLRTVLQLCSLQQASVFDPVDAAKQIAAFPPNFIHSLDATHMFRTALACYRASVTFASVHDCFWTHAGSVHDMNRILREEFVAMHREPILQRLRDEFIALYRDYKVPVLLKDSQERRTRHAWRNIYIPPLPERGDFDLTQVLGSKYFFS